jgi:hypothetical protein
MSANQRRKLASDMPIPSKDAAALADIITALARDHQITLRAEGFSACPDGRVAVTLHIERPSALSGKGKTNVVKAVNALLSKSMRWQRGSQNDLSFKTVHAVPGLKGARVATRAFMNSLGLSGNMIKHPIALKYLGAAEKLIDTDNPPTDQVDILLALADNGLSSRVNKLDKTALGRLLQKAHDSMVDKLIGFAAILEVEFQVRQWYINQIRSEALKTLAAYKSGKLHQLKALRQAHAIRDTILWEARSRSTVVGKALAFNLKKESPNFSELLDLKASRQAAGKTFAGLNPSQQKRTVEDFIRGAGRDKGLATKAAKIGGVLGRSIFVLTFAVAVYEVVRAENKLLEAAKQATIAAGGVGGALAGGEVGAAIGTIGGPLGIAIGAVAGAIIGGILGAFGAEYLFDEIVETVENFEDVSSFEFTDKLLRAASPNSDGLSFLEFFGLDPSKDE